MILIILACVICIAAVNRSVAESSTSAVGFQGNMGIMVAMDDASYFGEPVDLYPEVGFWIEQFPVSIGGTLGVIYRSYETTYYSTFGSYYDEGTVLVAPIMIRFDLTIPPDAPADLSLYLGVGGGIYAVLDGPHETALAVSGRGGMSIRFDPIRLYGELRIEPTLGGGSQLGTVLVTTGAAVALPF